MILVRTFKDLGIIYSVNINTVTNPYFAFKNYWHISITCTNTRTTTTNMIFSIHDVHNKSEKIKNAVVTVLAIICMDRQSKLTKLANYVLTTLKRPRNSMGH